MAWVHLEENAQNHYVICKHGWNIYVGPDRVPRFETRTASNKDWDTLAAAKPIALRKWTQVAIGAVAGYPLELGRYGPGRSQYLSGMIDELRIFARALPAAEVGEKYRQQRDQSFKASQER
jgi:hypothetical protein